MPFAPSSVALVTTSKALVTTSDALLPSKARSHSSAYQGPPPWEMTGKAVKGDGSRHGAMPTSFLLLVTSALLVVTSALLVVTKSY